MRDEKADKIEKRSYPRVKKLYLISYTNKVEGRQASPVAMGRTLDISPSGIRLEVYQKIKVNSEMEMNIGLGQSNFFVQGKVVRIQEIGEKDYIIGIQFDEIQSNLDDKKKGVGQWDHMLWQSDKRLWNPKTSED